MQEIKKARWSSDGDTIHMGVEISKVNKAKRLVSGWATLDNIDSEGDVVTAEASLDAFSRARGNLREMHKKDSAVGRVVSFKEDTFRAPDGNVYKGIFVTARVSEGAQDTWLKVLDGTLSGFSIGGQIVQSEEDWTKDGSQKIRKVTKYNLTELSLVDNPGNQYADVFRIQKSADGSVTSISGMVEEQKILNVFFCDEDEITKEAPSDSYECPVCDKDMTVIGYIEDGSDRDRKVSALITKYLSREDNTEGGETMTKGRFTGVLRKSVVGPEDNETEATGHDASDVQEVPAPAQPANEPVEEVEEVETADTPEEVNEVHDASDEITKQIDGLKKSIKDILDDKQTQTDQKIEALEKTIKETTDFLDKRISEVDGKFSDLSTDLGKARNHISSLETTIEKMNRGGALKKSVDLDVSTEPEQNEDPWANSAFSVRGITSGHRL